MSDETLLDTMSDEEWERNGWTVARNEILAQRAEIERLRKDNTFWHAENDSLVEAGTKMKARAEKYAVALREIAGCSARDCDKPHQDIAAAALKEGE